MSSKKQPSLVEEHFEPVDVEDDDGSDYSDASAASRTSEEEPAFDKDRTKKKSHVPRLYEVKDERHAETFFNRVSLAKEDSLPLGERVAALQRNQRAPGAPNDVKLGPGGSREISFISRSSAKYVDDDEEDRDPRREKRRGIQSLGLKSDKQGFPGRGRGNRGRGRRGRR